ncbi:MULTISPECIES: DEAD/DEAH box helicase [unclassified Janthinobacterium]|uniref:DEAD/DEAH box helicase n=1 Tax=unclassified Janthinobacterium TaxID=2610881 RepID=UPI0016119430|nr:MULTISPECIES: DEAD/DEAH box helicase [unclassified Janthinobacterium]MBB5368545.1 Ni2+-binding GTPase involved in maturation of urease and hydrogenase [Janthinobacterium sp. K2C7]MBB5381919.1 Ni2+-binding GTPase involved in maturation of urease and hydrogenase [Janthinobacterium sp. K2Li3]MBB5386927.1 Ni2+-binding GTPase involved in maturation of urease and hydrogenase [Janthinobacterium sp. K2E3]
MSETLTLRIIRSSKISELLKKLYFSENSDKQSSSVLKIALLFLNSEKDVVKEFGYRLLLKYANKTGNFVPLYDVAALLGFTPIMSLLKQQSLLPENNGFLDTLMSAYRENFKVGDIYQTENQSALFKQFSDSVGESIAVVAPTSYGKSQLIEQSIATNQKLNIAILVPSKALISQTRRRVLAQIDSQQVRQVIVHHDMAFDIQQPLIAVVTQERLLRLLQKNPTLSFDLLFVDEAHNLLSDDKRARLLASVIIIARIRNNNLAVKYLTPFLISSDSLKLSAKTHDIREIKILEKLKTEDYYTCDIHSEKKLKLYDQFMNDFYDTGDRQYLSEIELLLEKKKNKNIVYLNKPKSIEIFAEQISNSFEKNITSELNRVCDEISEYVHPDYRILGCLRRGVAYHHGAVPDVVRAYIETSFRKDPSVKWIITNSTLLEGVNIPAETLFVLDARKGRGSLTTPQFRNLVGRVNRFSEIFDLENGDPKLLLPSIYLINCNYSRANSNYEKYLTKVAKIDGKIDDVISNPLLSGAADSAENAKKKAEDFAFIENIEPNGNLRPDPTFATTEVGRLCHIHSVFEFDIFKHEKEMEAQVKIFTDKKIQIGDATILMQLISELFVSKIDDEDAQKNKAVNLLRLRNTAAQAFYAMFFDWRINQVNYSRMIGNFIKYWKKIVENEKDTIVFVGRWGTIPREGFIENYVDLKTLSDYEMINLAIVRIKEEQDFLDNTLVKFLEILNDLQLIEEQLYNKVKYGTNDADQIALIKNGFSHIAANVLLAKYRQFFQIDEEGKVSILAGIRNSFQARQEKELITFEVEWSGLIGK